ncbi:lactonase family protein [Cytophaga sp. FL35]|uniref:lactonase family protein n=1 Tax=Cytophaga sp. FL35 TaxID=1904456 RepID=UPI001653C15A|nr:lactonase family protein [Cytophaga sp. FL35]MBC6997082.1 lactonase family protein [Cytophaga sp. FL35]
MRTTFGFLLLPMVILLVLSCKEQKKEAETENYEKNFGIEPLQSILIGTFATGEKQGIYQVQFNSVTGKLSNLEHLVKEENPGYLYLSKDGKHVYSSNGVTPGSISTFTWSKDGTKLTKTGNHPSLGNGACYVSANNEENLIAAANYGSGDMVVYPLDNSGKLIDQPTGKTHSGSGPHKNQKSAHAHCAKFSEDGKFLYVADLGIDQIVGYPIDKNKIGEAFTALQLNPGDGPRHLIFQPKKNRAYIINELSSTIISATADPVTGVFKKIDKKSTLPHGYEGPNACADIHLSNDGNFLYASNRGHNSIAIFKVSKLGELQLLETEPVRGDWPRNFVLAPNSHFLLVANRKTNNISVFKRDPKSGLLTFTQHQLEVPQPVCLKFR